MTYLHAIRLIFIKTHSIKIACQLNKFNLNICTDQPRFRVNFIVNAYLYSLVSIHTYICVIYNKYTKTSIYKYFIATKNYLTLDKRNPSKQIRTLSTSVSNIVCSKYYTAVIHMYSRKPAHTVQKPIHLTRK